MPPRARRVFRLSLITALALAAGYGLALPLPFIAPIFALILSLSPAAPFGPKTLITLVLLTLITLGIGLLLIPVLISYPLSAVLIVAIGLYLSNFLTVNMGKGIVGTFLTLGFTLIPAAGMLDFSVALIVVEALAVGIGVAIVCQWIVFPWLPDDPAPPRKKAKPTTEGAEKTNWVALRATLIVLPPFLLALANPSMYLSIIMKSVTLGQQGSMVDARDAGHELLGSTFLAGFFAIPFWILLKSCPSLWMFFLWTLLFGIYFASKIYGIIRSRYPVSFWQNVAVTLFILLGTAVQDSANGDDVYTKFALRLSLFIAVTLYAWLAIYLLELLRTRRTTRKLRLASDP